MSKEIKKQLQVTKFWFIWNIIESIILLAGGVLAIVSGVLNEADPSTSGTIENVIAYVIAGFIILDGLLRLVLFLVRFQDGDEMTPMIVAGFELSLGTLMILLQISFASVSIFTFTIVNLIAVMLMVMGALILTFAIFQIARKMAKLTMPIAQIFLGAVVLGVGVAVEVLYNTESSRQMLVLILTGAILTVAAVGMFIITLVAHHKTKKALQQAQREEEGNYDVDDDGPRIYRKAEVVEEPKPADIVDVQETVPSRKEKDPEALSGPKAIDHKKD